MKAEVEYASGGKRYTIKRGHENLPPIPDIENVTIEDLVNLEKDTGGYGLILNFRKEGVVNIMIYDDYVE